MSNKLLRLRKKAAKRFFKSYKSLFVKEAKLRRWKKRLVTIHPCADEIELLKKIGCNPESCIVVDGYFFYKNQVCFFKIQSPEIWHKGITSPQISYSFSWEKYQSIMWKLHQFISFTHENTIFLLGFRIDTDVTDPQFYILWESNNGRPLDHNGYPIIFFSPDKYQEALAISTCQCSQLPIDLDSLNSCEYMDIAMTIYEIESLNKTTNVNIVDELNILLDFVAFLPDERVNMYYKKIMGEAADYFTFDGNIEGLFQAVDFSRFELIQAIEWSVGATGE